MINKKMPTWMMLSLMVLLCLAAGVTGSLLVRAYLPSGQVNSLSSDLNISRDSLKRANLIIENAKKIVVEQDSKVKETVSSGRNSIVGVFKKKKEVSASSEKNSFLINDYYHMNGEETEGLIVTSDGWIIAPNPEKGLSVDELIKNYVVVTKSKDVYSIDRVEKAGVEPYIFMHLSSVKDLPVKQLASNDLLSDGQMLVAVNWEGKSYVTSLFEKNKQSFYYESSDSLSDKIVLSDNLNSFFQTAFVFSLNGEVVAIYDQGSGVTSMGLFLPFIKGLLENSDFKYPSLGFNYVDLGSLVTKDSRYEKGAMIISDGKRPALEVDSAAAEAGLREGDIILSINGASVNSENHLSALLQKYQAGDSVSLIYLREGQERKVDVKLKELKK